MVSLTDGEEKGLLGAIEFVKQPTPWGSAKPFVINFDSRGSSCAAPMFETDENNLGYVRRLKGHLAWPRFTSSLMVSVYNQLPNKTDYTIFKSVRWPGFNFALIGGAHRYHTPEDTPENLSDRSLQHFAEHSTRLVTELSTWKDTDWNDADTGTPAVFFDVLGLAVICYPAFYNPFLTILAWVLFAIVAFRFQHEVRVRIENVALLFTAILAIAGSSMTLGWGLSTLMRGRVIERKYVEYGEVVALGYTFLAIFLCTTFGAWAFRRRNIYHARLGVLFTLALLSTFASILLQGGAYLFQWPIFFWATVCLIRPNQRWPDFAALGFMAILYAPLLALFPFAMGPLAGITLSGVSAVLLFPLLVLYSEFPSRSVDLTEDPQMQKDRLVKSRSFRRWGRRSYLV